MAKEHVTYKTLEILGHPDYRIGTDGSCWSKVGTGNHSRLSVQEVTDIKNLFASGKYRQREIAIKYGIVRSTVSNIVTGRLLGRGPTQEWVKLKRCRASDGRPKYKLGGKWYGGHILVLTAFVCPRPKGLVGCHNNGNCEDCNLSNLRWDTPQANEDDKILHGTNSAIVHVLGEYTNTAKLTEDEVLKIRSMYATGNYKQNHLSKIFGICPAGIHAVVHRRNWRHI